MSKEICWKEVSDDKKCRCVRCSKKISCSDKVKYASQIEARKERGWKEEEHNTRFTIYHCASCEGWHLASVGN